MPSSRHQVKGGSLGEPCGFVGTNPALVIRRLANPARALVVALTPRLLAKPILKEMGISETGGGKGPWRIPVTAASPAELGEPTVACDSSALGCVGREGSIILHFDCPFGTCPSRWKSHLLPSSRKKSRFNIWTTQMKCHGKSH